MSTPTEERGDQQIRIIWKHQTDCILEQRRHFSPFVVSCDGVLGNEAKVVLLTLQEASPRNQKRRPTYSETSNAMKSRMSIAIVRRPTSASVYHWGTTNVAPD